MRTSLRLVRSFSSRQSDRSLLEYSRLNGLLCLHKVRLFTEAFLLFGSSNPLVSFDEFDGSMQLYGQLVAMDKQSRTGFKEAVDVLQGT